MKHALAIALLAVGAAHAQGFAPLSLADTGDVCYGWNGGAKSSGSFSRCNPVGYVRPAKPQVVATPVASPQIAPSPIMMPMTCPPLPAKPIVKPKRKPAPKC